MSKKSKQKLKAKTQNAPLEDWIKDRPSPFDATPR